MLTKEPFEKKCRNKIFYNSAREAFYELLKQIDLKQDEYILMPSYIGQSLKEGSGVFDPIRRLKLNYKFYKLNALLNINFKDIESQCNKYKIKVIFIIHYFGILQPQIEELSSFCKKNNIILIEDCAHTFIQNNLQVGDYGDFAIFSIHKCCPTQYGGILKINNIQSLNINNFKSVIDNSSLLTYSELDFKLIKQKRRTNFQHYLNNIKENEYLKLFYTDLNKNANPLNFPILIEKLDRFEIYKKLVNYNIPVVSLWYKLIDEINIELYKNTHDISSKILNLPVHQDIDFDDINYILEKLNKVCKNA